MSCIVAVACVISPGVAQAAGPAGIVASPANAGLANAGSYGAIGGVVRSVTGAGLGRICVTAVGRSIAVPAVTSAGGQYLIPGLLPGKYTVEYRACRPSGRYLASPATPVSVLAGQPTRVGPVTLRSASGAALIAASKPVMAALAEKGPAGKPVVSGTVTSTRGKPLSGICVGASQVGSGGESGAPPSAMGVSTTRDGSYSIPGGTLPAGRWTIEFFAGCGNNANFAPQWWKYAATGGKAATLRIKQGSHFTGIDAKLVPGAAVSGVIRAGSRSGAGLPGVCVLVSGVGAASYVYTQGVSGPGGKYLITGLSTGRYQVQFQPGCGNKGNYSASNYPGTAAATDGKTTKGIDWYVPVAGEISGVVTTGTARTPVPGICVATATESGGVIEGEEVVTGREGGFALDGLSAGRYVVVFEPGCGDTGSYVMQYYDNQIVPADANEITVHSGQDVGRVDASLQAGGTVSGTVTSGSGEKLSGICVLVTPDSSGLGSALLGLPPGFASLVGAGLDITAGGRYQVKNLIPGNYAVSFSTGCGPGSGPSYAAQWFAPQGGGAPAWVSVGTRDVPDIDARLRLAGSISGVVRNSAGHGVEGICPVAVGLTGEPSAILAELFGGGGAIGSSDRSGNYQLTGLGAGKYAIQLAPCGSQPYAVSWYPDSGEQASARPVSVKDGQNTGKIDAVVTAGSAISGRVSAAGGVPVGGICVGAFDSDGNLVSLGVSQPNGDYDVELVPPGTFSLEFSRCEGQGKLAMVVKADVQVRRARPTSGVNVTLPLAGTLAGQVTGGSPAVALAGICVSVTPQTGIGAPDVAYTGADGRYTLPGLAPGGYLVEFSAQCPYRIGGFGSQSSALVTVAGGQTLAGVSATLEADGGISGTVTQSGAAVPGVCVLAYPVTGGGAPVLATTGTQGGYLIAGLNPGDFKVEFTGGCPDASYQTQWYQGASGAGSATPVPVTTGSVTPLIDAH